MGLISIICPSCGGKLEVDDGRDGWFCQYCGVRVEREKKLVELSGNVSVNGVETVQNTIERGFIFLEDGNFNSAFRYFDKALDKDAHAAMAYIGILLCKLGLRNVNALNYSKVPLESYDDFQKALKFAQGEDKVKIDSWNKNSKENFRRENDKYLSVVNPLLSERNANNEAIERCQQFIKKDNIAMLVNTGILCVGIVLVICGSSGSGGLILLGLLLFLFGLVMLFVYVFKEAGKNREKNKLIKANNAINDKILAENNKHPELFYKH